jgi:hypothetical protein
MELETHYILCGCLENAFACLLMLTKKIKDAVMIFLRVFIMLDAGKPLFVVTD